MTDASPLAFHQGISTPLLHPILNSITKEPIFFFENKTSSAIGILISRRLSICLSAVFVSLSKAGLEERCDEFLAWASIWRGK